MQSAGSSVIDNIKMKPNGQAAVRNSNTYAAPGQPKRVRMINELQKEVAHRN